MELRDDMIQALHGRVELTQTVKARAALAGMDSLTERGGAEEIEVVDAGGAVERAGVRAKCATASGKTRKGGANLVREQHLDEVAGFAALDEPQSAAVEEAMDGGTSGALGDANAVGEPSDGEMEAALALQMTMTEEEAVDGAIKDVERQVRDQEVVELFPHECGVGNFAFHG